MSIKLKINLPEICLAEETAAKVLLPIDGGTLTIIKDRAPRLQILSSGVVASLDDDNRAVKKWFINGGIADIAEDVCRIAAEKAVCLNDLTLEEAKEKAKSQKFYKEIYGYLKAFG